MQFGLEMKCGNYFSKVARTFLRTPRDIPALKKCDGDYVYFGIETGVLNLLSQNKSLKTSGYAVFNCK